MSTYQPSTDNYWVAMVVLGSVTMILSGPGYYFVSKWFFHDQCGERRPGSSLPPAGLDDDRDDVIQVSLAPDRLAPSDDTRGYSHA